MSSNIIKFKYLPFYFIGTGYCTCGVEVVSVCGSRVDVLHNGVHVHNVLIYNRGNSIVAFVFYSADVNDTKSKGFMYVYLLRYQLLNFPRSKLTREGLDLFVVEVVLS